MESPPEALDRRRAGVLLHPTSLPGPADNGDFGPEAYRFIEFLAAAGLSVWQVLPLGPTLEHGSPYQCLSVHAGSSRLISLEWLRERGWLDDARVLAGEGAEAVSLRLDALQQAFLGFRQSATSADRQAFDSFTTSNAWWLDDYVLFIALRRDNSNRGWTEWPAPLRDRDPHALRDTRSRLATSLEQARFEQFVFFQQWHGLRDYAHRHGIRLFGDIPIFVAHDSADVWAHRRLFDLDAKGLPATVAGVPPDYFSATGQLWGNPLYRWPVMEETGFQWWMQRMQTQMELFDLIRIDHFRGLEAYWEIPGDAPTAESGHWVPAPGKALLAAIQDRFGRLPIVAEDLGIITPEVDALRRAFGIPGMRVLQFAFGGGADNLYLPHNHERNSVVYTGTHDNDTTAGWFGGLDRAAREHVQDYLGHPKDPMPWPMIRAALGSTSLLAILPVQDLLSLGAEHRMNVPGTAFGNWTWRFTWKQVPGTLAERIRHLTALYGRLP